MSVKEILVNLFNFFFFISLKDRVKKLTAEKDVLESHLKNEKDEKELYKVKSVRCQYVSCSHHTHKKLAN